MKPIPALMLMSWILSGPALHPASAQSPVVDGSLDAEFYGAPLAVQNTPTAFGNATNGHPRFAVQGSELDAAYARISDGYLFLFFAGNLETYGQGVQWSPGNRNTLDVFIDAFPGGQNGLRGDNADVDGGALAAMGHLDPDHDGLHFDSGFDADVYLTFHNQTEVIPYYDPPQVEAWRGSLFVATLPSAGGGEARSLGIAQDPTHSSFPPTFSFTNGVLLGFNNSNTGGVWGTGDPNESDTSLAAIVTTGLELALPIELLADPEGTLGPEIRIIAFINDIQHRYLSNQVLGPMGQSPGGYGNLGDPRLFNFAADYSPGDQFFSASNPYPSARAMLAPVPGGNGLISHQWLASIGHSYVLQTCSNLAAPLWTNASPSLPAATPLLSISLTNPAPRAFFRVRQTD